MRDNLCLILTIPLAAAITFGLFSVTQAKRHRESESKANKTAEQWKRDYEIEHRHLEQLIKNVCEHLVKVHGSTNPTVLELYK